MHIHHYRQQYVSQCDCWQGGFTGGASTPGQGPNEDTEVTYSYQPQNGYRDQLNHLIY